LQFDLCARNARDISNSRLISACFEKMERLTTSTASASAAAAAAEAGTAVAPLASQARLILSAALQVAGAFRMLVYAVINETTRWGKDRPKIIYTATAFPITWMLYAAVRNRVNANWERGLHDARTARSLPKHALLAARDAQSCAQSEVDSAEETAEEDEDLPDRCEALRTPPALSRMMSTERSLAVSRFSHGRSCLLSQNGSFGDMDPACHEFLRSHMKVLSFRKGDTVFTHGSSRDAFLIVKSGSVTVELVHRPDTESYTLGAGETVVGMMFIQAGMEVIGSTSAPPSVCGLHNSSARAGPEGADIIALPTSAFAAAFDAHPRPMQQLVHRLCVRLELAVFETLSTYFCLRREMVTPSAYKWLDSEPSQIASLSPSEVFQQVLGHAGNDEGVKEVLASAVNLECAAGEMAVPKGQRPSHLLILIEGELEMICVSENEQNPSSTHHASELQDGSMTLVPGQALGAFSALVDKPAPIIYRCRSRCRFAALPREASQKLFHLCPRAWCLKLLHSVAAHTASWLHRIDAGLEWLHVEGGRSLYHKGDPMHGFFVVLCGRLLTLEEVPAMDPRVRGRGGDQRPHWQVTDILQRGRLCGELDCLRGRPYSQTVRASRDTEVCQVSPSVLHLISIDFPKAILHFSSLVGPQKSVPVELSSRHKATITVVPATKDVNVHEVCSRLTCSLQNLGKTLHISPDSDLVGTKALAGKARSFEGSRFARLLIELEEKCRWLVYEAEPVGTDGHVTDWTQRCVRQADHIIVVVNFDGRSRGDVQPSTNECYIEEATPLYVERELLLLHTAAEGAGRRRSGWTDDWLTSTDDLLRPGLEGFVAHHTQQLFLGTRASRALRSTRHYLRTRTWARRWHHVRASEGGDWARCARLLAGCGIGICLGGGGSRGNCHFGVIRAMEELGIPIDVVSGTSFGALAGAIYAVTAPQPGSMMTMVDTVMRKKFSKRNMFMDLNFPRTSWFTGSYMNWLLKDSFARRRCEDLLVPFMCTSTDIVHFDEKTHREGPLWRVVRASMSLVGFLPPLPFQERRVKDGTLCSSLLVDGGYSNQYPIEVLKQHGAGCVICVVACPDYGPVGTEYGDVVRGGLVSLRRMFRFKQQPNLDPPSQAEIQERLMFLVEFMKEHHTSRADLTLYPEIEKYGLLDFSKYQEIVEAGHSVAMPRLKEWLATESDAAKMVNKIIKWESNSGQSFQSSKEHGSRKKYGTWRKTWRAFATIRASRLLRGVRGASSNPDFSREESFA